ncbi:hypothetical protein BOTBODRAFT_65067 [Botryobasidium botryosum FD-172 SS1]|uniref:Choline/carnitine acyltransferase domain-containing protein n=1 Tax=Botryobasidium botryosum (strain FD-172 SS1) TaxID=930990 RepID=A0A067MN51_BOTB1|nr:hypothetical protein BOTBODRAFT_65067 [Botryobasidium botryosum FD-172 SS1]
MLRLRRATPIARLRTLTRPMSSTANTTRPANWKARAPAPPNGTPTFSQQSALKPLPVPALSSTLEQLKVSVAPLARSNEELEAVTRKIGSFGDGFAKVLQERLEARANEPGRLNWLEEFWDDAGYLGYRDSVVINVSYYYGFVPHPSHLSQAPASRAAALTRSALLFRRQLKRGEVTPDAARDGAFCMDLWRWMFDCSRIPGIPYDWSVSYAKAGDTGESGTVVFLRKGRVWEVDIAPAGKILSTAELEQQIQHIYDNTTREYPAVGVLTASNRDVWTKDYGLLRESKENDAILKALHSSALIVCLDTEQPSSKVEFSKAIWHGGVEGGQLGNRWVDKPCQFIVFDNGKAGIMGEHSVMDGTPTVRMCDEVLGALQSPSFDHGSPSSSSSAPPKPLDWEITPAIEKAISAAQTAAHELVSSQRLSFFETDYGKNLIKTFGVAPDSWAQMVMQLAYRRLLGPDVPLPGGTYEAATTRRFQHGRTETIRVVKKETVAWTKSMDREGVSAEEKRRLFREACDVHIRDAKLAGKAMGVDRHLFGLKNMIKEGESVPEMYSDPVYARSSRWVLSTSQISSPHFDVYGWGEVVPDGFGLPYAIYPDKLMFTVTSRKEMPNEKFSKEIARAAEDLKDLFTSEHKSKL